MKSQNNHLEIENFSGLPCYPSLTFVSAVKNREEVRKNANFT